jgi:hypothetical protein
VSKFATGKYALGVSDRSGFVYKLNDMRKEWTGALVGPDEWEKKQPQLDPRKHVTDPQALKDPRPTTPMVLSIYVAVPLVENPNLRPATSFAQVGQVTVNTNTTGNTSVTLSGLSSTSAINGVAVSLPDSSVTVTGVTSSSAVGSVTPNVNTEFTVTVVSTGYGNKYFIDGSQQPTLNLNEGSTYKFDQSDNSNNNHPLRFSTTSDGTHSGGTEYTTGVTTNGIPGQSGAYTEITVAVGAPTLYYYCSNHPGMGGQANTP